METPKAVTRKPFRLRLGGRTVSLPAFLLVTVLATTLVIHGIDLTAGWLFVRKASRAIVSAIRPDPMPLVEDTLDHGLQYAGFSSDRGNLPLDEIDQMYRDPQGIIWALGSRGLFVFNGQSFQALEVVKAFPAYHAGLLASGITGSEDGTVYIHFAGIGLCAYHRERKEMEFLAPTEEDAGNMPRAYMFKQGPSIYYSAAGSQGQVRVYHSFTGEVKTLSDRITGHFMEGREPGSVSFYAQHKSQDSIHYVTYRDTTLLDKVTLKYFGFEHTVAVSPDSVYLFGRNHPRVHFHNRRTHEVRPVDFPADPDSTFWKMGNVTYAYYDPVHREIYLSFWRGLSIIDPFRWKAANYPCKALDPTRFAPPHAPVSCLTRDLYGNLWLGFYGDGIARLELSNSEVRNHFMVTGPAEERLQTINQITESANGDILVSTRDGIVVTDRDFRTRRTVRDSSASKLACNKNWITNLQPIDANRFIVGSWGNPPTVFQRKEGGWEFLPQRYTGPPEFVCGCFNRDIVRWGDHWIFSSWGLHDAFQAADIEGKTYFRRVRDRNGAPLGPSSLTIGLLISGDELWMAYSDKGVALYRLQGGPERTEVRGDTLVLDAVPVPVPFSPALGKDFILTDIMKMMRFSDGRIGILSIWGIYVKSGEYLERADVPVLAGKVLRSMAEDPATGNIWVGTSEGLYRFSPDLKEFQQYIGVSNGMRSASINGLYFLKDGRLVADTKQGLSVTESRFRTALPPSVIVDEVRFDGVMSIPEDRVYKAASSTGQVTLSLFTTQYHAKASNSLRYALNRQKAWIDAGKGPFLNLDLPYGRHELHLRAVGLDGNTEGPVQTLFIVMPAPWYAAWWFRTLVLGAIVSVFILYRNERRQAAKRLRRMNETIQYLRLQTIHAQMNPHFIFNTLGTMQYFILNSDPLAANRLLVKLSRLIRNYLDASVKSTYSGAGLVRNEISLRQELDLIEDYMEFERIQQNQSFQFITDIDPQIDPDAISLPPMLIQPFLENAVKHGIAYLETGGVILLKVRYGQDGLSITIRDNGIGREASRKKQEGSLKAYRSYGSDLVRLKVDLLNELGYHIHVEYTDLEPGLEVHIFIHN